MKILIVFITLLVQAVLFSQEKDIKYDAAFLKEKDLKISKLIKIDYINKSYKYLDSNFKIKISKNQFDKLFLHEQQQTRTYKDSLMIVLYAELGDNDAVNIAFHRILFSWKQLSFYIWENESNTKQLAESFGFKHPYSFFEFIGNPTNDNANKIEILKKMQTKISEKKIDTISLKPYNKFLDYAFKFNPERLKYNAEYLQKRRKK